MLTLPPKFKQALGNGTRTSLYPLVRIYKGYQIDDTIPDNAEAINLSIKETTIKNLDNTYESYIPLLLNSPSISSKADIINNKYTISSVSLSISNAPYNGKIFSDDIPSLLNAVVQVYYAANGLDSLDDCLLVYTGTIRRYSQSAETLNLTLEDLTEQKLKTKIPATLIEDEENYSTNLIGKPYPMVYGLVDNSPLILSTKLLPDSIFRLEIDKPSKNIKDVWNGAQQINFGNNSIQEGHPLVDGDYLQKIKFLSIFDEKFIPIYQLGVKDWGSRDYSNLTNSEIYQYNPATESSANITINTETLIHTQFDAENNEGVGEKGIPSRVYRPIVDVQFFSAGQNNINNNGLSRNDTTFIAYQNDDGKMDNIIETISEDVDGNNENSPAQDLYNNFWNSELNEGNTLNFWQPTEINEYTGDSFEVIDTNDEKWLEFYNNSYKSSKFPISWIQNNNYDDNGNNLSGLHISSQGVSFGDSGGAFARLILNDNIGDFACVTKLVYDITYFTAENMGVDAIDTGNGTLYVYRYSHPSSFWVQRELKQKDHILNITNQVDWYNSNDKIWYETGEFDEIIKTDCEVPNYQHEFDIAYNLLDENNNPTFATKIFQNELINSDTLRDNIMKDFDSTNKYDSIQWGSYILNEGPQTYVSSCIANLREFYVLQDILIDDIKNRKYFADVAGRANNNELIKKINTILKDILEDELLYNGNIDETNTDIQSDWQYAFTLNEQKEAKSLFEGMFKSSLLIPSFDSAGQFKFIGIKQIIDSYDDIVFIKTEDVVKYSFELTKIDDIYNSVNVKYKKNYGSGEYDEQTGYTIADTSYINLDEYTTTELGYSGNNAYDIGYYGLDSEDAKLEVETEYIRDKYTAQKLQKRLLLWYANQHLITKIDLPLSYINLEAGDYIKFSELLGNKFAFGYDYSKVENRNGQLIYPVFFVTKVSKSLNKISIEAVQVHRGEYGFPDFEADTDPDAEDTGDIVNGNGDDVTENNQIPNAEDDPNYSEDSIGTDEFEVVEDDYLRIQMSENRTLNNNQVVGIVSTNMDESWEYNIWVRNLSVNLDIDGNGEIDIAAGSYEIGDKSGMDLVNHALTMQDSNGYITIEKKFEIFPQGAVIEFVLEVKNTQFVLEEGFDQLGINEEDITIGDLNNDLNVNILDVVRLVQIILGHGNEPTNLEEIAGNVNQDDRINVQDAVLLINEILGQ
tara:strand:- start:1529 stop:5119 length:3591 start_codon:yes stop_codon:yes gene_type:complete